MAGNSQGTSPASYLISVTTLEGFPTAAPTNIALTALSPFSLNVMWEAVDPRYHNGMLLYYEVVYQGTSFDQFQLSKTVNYTISSTEVNELHPADEYTVFLIAINTVGHSPTSETVSILLPESVPNVSPIFENATAGYSTIDLRWGGY